MLSSQIVTEEHTIVDMIHIDGESVVRITTSSNKSPTAPRTEIMLPVEYKTQLVPGTPVSLRRLGNSKTYLTMQIGDMVFDL
jgi:hypothetical protein